MGDITKDSKYGAGKSYKGQDAVLEGSLSGEIIITTKFSYDSTLSLEYLGEAKVGTDDTQSKWFINKFIYDPSLNLIEILTATNQVTADAAEVSVDVTSDSKFVIVTLPNGGDFSPVTSMTRNNTEKADVLNLTTPTQKLDCLPIFETNRGDTVKVRKTDIPPNILVGLVDEANAQISKSDLTMTLNNALTKDYNKRRWDLRARYIYK